ncbi:CDP-glucose 4,6-dehydratase [Lysinibacillus telephonicus]|uniref:CDP-glucose 4,6-dehydratase n=1 Tax=Lysinibacillus telephonicus TaxID=1714840 RepID=A0A3S0HNP1_9BACI|nr:CDP-glucose 4,6-dehydratase [Lysinibacillus telephonicus]RTQ94290.1 CDP-glucose 4,6-dehydratase [Lysinibacillus telephonicus]
MIDKTFWNGKKVFLTGHTGFKGSWLSFWLHNLGAKVMGYSLEPSTSPSLYYLAEIDKLVDSVIGDIRDLEYLKKKMIEFNPDIVIHMAAQPLVRKSYENPVETYSTNVMGTVNIFEAVRICKNVKSVINVTTDKVYENKEWDWGYRESDKLGGYDPYSNSKACSELVSSAYINSFFNPLQYAQHGIAIATVRAGNVIGGGDWAQDRLIPDCIRAIHDDKPIIIRNPNAIRPWQHVLEPLSGYLILVQKLYTKGTLYNGAWNFGPKYEDVKPVKWVVSKLIEKFGGNVLLQYEENNGPHEAMYLKLDYSKSKMRLGWEPKISLEESIDFVTSWYKNYNNNKDLLKIMKEQIGLYL